MTKLASVNRPAVFITTAESARCVRVATLPSQNICLHHVLGLKTALCLSAGSKPRKIVLKKVYIVLIFFKAVLCVIEIDIRKVMFIVCDIHQTAYNQAFLLTHCNMVRFNLKI